MATLDLARQAADLLKRVLTAATPDELSGGDAAALAAAFADAERMAAAGKALYAAHVRATDAYRDAGYRDAASWLAGASGDPVGRARCILDTADALAKSPAAQPALVGGELSAAQAQMIGSATAVDPSAGPELVALARRGSFRELRDGVSGPAAGPAPRPTRSPASAASTSAGTAASPSPTPAVCASTPGSPRPTGRGCSPGSTPSPSSSSSRPGRPGSGSRTNSTGPTRSSGSPTPPAIVMAASAVAGRCRTSSSGCDAAALRRGAVCGAEVCEIRGVGPVPVATARTLLGEGFFTLLVADGVDIRTVTWTTRTVPRALRVAAGRTGPGLRRPRLPGQRPSRDRPLAGRLRQGRPDPPRHDLARVCGPRHAMKTNAGWRLAGGPGRWRWLPPRDGPARRGRPSGRSSARARRMPWPPCAGRRQPLDQQDAVEVVELVLEDPALELVGLDGELVAVEVETDEVDVVGPRRSASSGPAPTGTPRRRSTRPSTRRSAG